MDYLAQSTIDKYHKKLKKEKIVAAKNWSFVALASLIVSIATIIASKYFKDYSNDLEIASFVSFGTFLVLIMIVVYIILEFDSSKPFYNFLYPEIIKDIEYNQRIIIDYKVKPKNQKNSKESNLFSPSTVENLSCRFSFINTQGVKVDIYDAKVEEHTQYSHINFLNGCYLVVNVFDSTLFQIRTKHQPHPKKLYTKLNHRDDVEAYAEKGKTSLDSKYFDLFYKIKGKVNSRELFISSINRQMHIGIDFKDVKRSLKTLDGNSYNEIKQNLLNLIEIANLES